MNLLAQTKYRVFLDESYKAEKWFLEEKQNKEQFTEIRGEYGTIYNFSPKQLAVYVRSIRVANKLPKIWEVIRDGDFERVLLLPDSDLDLACIKIKAQKRRIYRPEVLEKLRANAKKARQGRISKG